MNKLTVASGGENMWSTTLVQLQRGEFRPSQNLLSVKSAERALLKMLALLYTRGLIPGNGLILAKFVSRASSVGLTWSCIIEFIQGRGPMSVMTVANGL